MDWATVGVGIVIFFARIVDVSLGTLRVASIVQGRTRAAAGGFFNGCRGRHLRGQGGLLSLIHI